MVGARAESTGWIKVIVSESLSSLLRVSIATDILSFSAGRDYGGWLVEGYICWANRQTKVSRKSVVLMK